MNNYDGYLRTNMSKYKYGDAARRSINDVLRDFNDLRPGTEDFTYPDGTTHTLVVLNGTIPIIHRGNTYNIPVCLYLQHNTPYEPPLVFVKPTPTMQVRTSQHVESSGRINLPYLQSWRHPNTNMNELLQLMQMQFGEVPPVVSKPQRQQQQQQQQPSGGSYGWGAGYGWNQQVTQPQYSQPQYSMPQFQQQQSSTRQDNQEEALRMSVLSAAQEKLRRRYTDKRAQLQAELDVIRRTGQDLRDGQTKLDDIVKKLDAEQMKLHTYITTLQEKNAESESLLFQMSTQEQVAVDDAVDATAPLYRQIVRCYAEEQAIEDAVFALGDALKRDGIDIDAYLKNVRELSRRQFLLRATIQSGRTKAGLPDL